MCIVKYWCLIGRQVTPIIRIGIEARRLVLYFDLPKQSHVILDKMVAEQLLNSGRKSNKTGRLET